MSLLVKPLSVTSNSLSMRPDKILTWPLVLLMSALICAIRSSCPWCRVARLVVLAVLGENGTAGGIWCGAGDAARLPNLL